MRATQRVVYRHMMKRAAEGDRLRTIFEETIAPLYKSKASDKEILWSTAYEKVDHPNHEQAVKDYEKWKDGMSDKSIASRLIENRKEYGNKLIGAATKIGKLGWKALKKVAEQSKSEVAGMMVKTPKLLLNMATGNYDFKDKKQLKEDLKTIWGAAVYYGGITACVVAAGPAAPAVATLKSTAVALGKSVATHAVIGAMSPGSDFWGFLSFEAAETMAALGGKSDKFADFFGGALSTDLFDGAVGAVTGAFKTLAASDENESEGDKMMAAFLGQVVRKVGESMKSMDESEFSAE